MGGGWSFGGAVAIGFGRADGFATGVVVTEETGLTVVVIGTALIALSVGDSTNASRGAARGG